jgi:hypothetical protein
MIQGYLIYKALSTLILTKKSPTSVGVVVENLKGY